MQKRMQIILYNIAIYLDLHYLCKRYDYQMLP